MDDYNGFGDKMSSYWCGANVSFDFCDQKDGDCRGGDDLNSGAGNIRCSDGGNDNNLDRIYLRYYDPSTQGAITVFRDHNCTDDHARFEASIDPQG